MDCFDRRDIISMELIKGELVSLALLQVPLEQNFALIEEWMNETQREIKALKSNQEDYIVKLIEISRSLREVTSEKQAKDLIRDCGDCGSKESISLNSHPNILPNHPLPPQSKSDAHQVTVPRTAEALPSQNTHPQPQEAVKSRSPKPKNKQREFSQTNDHWKLFIEENYLSLQQKVHSLENINIEKDLQIADCSASIDLLMKTIGIQAKAKKMSSENHLQNTAKKMETIQTPLESYQTNNEKVQEDEARQVQQTSSIFQVIQRDFSRLKQFTQSKLKWVDEVVNENKIKIQAANQNLELIQRQKEACKFDSVFQRTESTHYQKINKFKKPQLQKVTNSVSKSQNKIFDLIEEIEQLKEEVLQIMSNPVEFEEECEGRENRPKTQFNKWTEGERRNSSSLFVMNELAATRKELNRLRREFDELMQSVNTGSNETKTYIIKPNENKEDWKTLSTKIHRTKLQLQSSIREVDNKIIHNHQNALLLQSLQRDLFECKTNLRKKVEITDYDKAYKRLESRLNNFIMQIFESKEADHDAMIVKQPWFCLSCDSELKEYIGKVGKVIPTEKPIGKKVNPESHMVRRNEYKKLPSVHK